VPVYNEESSLAECVSRVLQIADDKLSLEVVLVDDGSRDQSVEVATSLTSDPRIRLVRHEVNKGKGAALQTGFRHATGDFVAVQDADLEYDPQDLKRLLGPLLDGKADVVLGSRFTAAGAHRVLYFWHSIGNRFLTFLSNMFTDLNLTDMETCYKVFRREVLQSIELREQRFGFEPEIVAHMARLKLRIYEMGISYSGRTYEEGKKIGAKDGIRALYCIVRYNMPHAPLPIQFLGYLLVGGVCAIANIALFSLLGWIVSPGVAAALAFVLAAVLNYVLSVRLIFRSGAMWSTWGEMLAYAVVVALAGAVDVLTTLSMLDLGASPTRSKSVASAVALVFNFLGRRYLVFSETRRSSRAMPVGGRAALGKRPSQTSLPPKDQSSRDAAMKVSLLADLEGE
jgi:glycosyltransferase involved in cell wall biosynthesis